MRRGVNRFLGVATDRLGDEPREGGEGAMSMLEGEEGERADDDYAKGQPVSGKHEGELLYCAWELNVFGNISIGHSSFLFRFLIR